MVASDSFTYTPSVSPYLLSPILQHYFSKRHQSCEAPGQIQCHPPPPKKKKGKKNKPKAASPPSFINIDNVVCGEQRTGVQKDSPTLKSFICIRLVSEPYRSDCSLPERLTLCLIVWLPEGWSDYTLVQHGKVMGLSAHSSVLYVHRIIMFTVWWVVCRDVERLSHHCPCTITRCHRMVPPAELYQQDVGKVEE